MGDRRMALPRPLIVSLVYPHGRNVDQDGPSASNVAALARLFLAYGCVDQARDLCIEFLEGHGDVPVPFGVHPEGDDVRVWVPYQVLDEISLAPGQASFLAVVENCYV